MVNSSNMFVLNIFQNLKWPTWIDLWIIQSMSCWFPAVSLLSWLCCRIKWLQIALDMWWVGWGKSTLKLSTPGTSWNLRCAQQKRICWSLTIDRQYKCWLQTIFYLSFLGKLPKTSPGGVPKLRGFYSWPPLNQCFLKRWPRKSC